MVREEKKQEFEQQMIDLARVTRVVAGGKRLRFRACVAIGNKKGEVGLGLAKGQDVAIAIEKAVRRAQKNIIKVPIIKGTIPHSIKVKYKAARVLLRPAQEGKGIVAGGATRIILSLAGLENVTAKTLGSKNKINNAKATIKALSLLQARESRPKPKDQELKFEN